MPLSYEEWQRALRQRGDAAEPPTEPLPAIPPGQSNQRALFRPAEADLPTETVEAKKARLDPKRRDWCRWCLEPFDPDKLKPRTIWERGTLRSHLMMHDDGTELSVCDNCWYGAFGAAIFLHGQAVPASDPNVVPNLLLRQTLKE